MMWRWSRRDFFVMTFFVCNKGLFSWKLNGVNESKVRMEIRRSKKNGGQSRETGKHKEKRSKNKRRKNGDDGVTTKY